MKSLFILLAIVLMSSFAYADSLVVLEGQNPNFTGIDLIDVDHFATSDSVNDVKAECARCNSRAAKEMEDVREDMTHMNSISTAMASLELDPTRDGFSMGVAIGVADFADGDDEFAEAIGLMYGKDDKAVNFKYGRSGSYSAAGVGLTMGF